MSKMSQTISVCVSDSPTHIVVWQESKKESVSEVSMSTVLATVDALTKRIAALENQLSQQRVNSTFFPSTISPTPTGLEVLRAAVTQKVEAAPAPAPAPTEAIKQVTINLPSSIPLLEKIDVNVQEEEGVEEIVEEEDEVVDEEEEEVVEEEEDVMQLEPFEWKGVTYYKDSDNQVYQTDSDGDIDDSPIGVWNETKQKIVKFAATS